MSFGTVIVSPPYAMSVGHVIVTTSPVQLIVTLLSAGSWHTKTTIIILGRGETMHQNFDAPSIIYQVTHQRLAIVSKIDYLYAQNVGFDCCFTSEM